MLLKNTSSHRVVCEALGFAVDPGDTVEVENGYCVPRASVPGTAPGESAIRMLCPQLVPADEKLLGAWLANEAIVKAPPPPPPTTADLEATGMSAGVAALAASGAAAVAPKPTRTAPQAPPPKKAG